MDTESAFNETIIESLAKAHHAPIFPAPIRERLDNVESFEFFHYVLGRMAADRDVEDLRFRALSYDPLEQCEISRHFWRGVLDSMATMGLMYAKKKRRKSERKGSEYPYLRLRGTPYLLDRFREYLISKGIDHEQFNQKIQDYTEASTEEEQNKALDRVVIRLTGITVRKIVTLLYANATLVKDDNTAQAIMQWDPITVSWDL